MTELRNSFYKERNAEMYGTLAFVLSILLSEVPFVLFQQFVGCVLIGFLIGFGEIWYFAWYFMILSILLLCQVYFGYVLIAACKTLTSASLIASILSSFHQLLGGFNPPASTLSKFWQILSYCIPFRYAFSALVAIFYSHCPENGDSSETGCVVLQNGVPITIDNQVRITYTMKELVKHYYGVNYDDLDIYIGALVAFMLTMIVFAAIVFRFFCNHATR